MSTPESEEDDISVDNQLSFLYPVIITIITTIIIGLCVMSVDIFIFNFNHDEYLSFNKKFSNLLISKTNATAATPDINDIDDNSCLSFHVGIISIITQFKLQCQNDINNNTMDDINMVTVDKYFSEIHNHTKLALSGMGKNIKLLNVYEINVDDKLKNLHIMWLSSIYDVENHIYWSIIRTLERDVRWIISIYSTNSSDFSHKLVQDTLFGSKNVRLSEPRLFYLNKYTILAAVHNGGKISVVNFTKLVVEPTKQNNFSSISISLLVKFNNCILQNDTENHKNWSPIIINGTLHFVIKHQPLKVIKCNNICSADICTVIYREMLPKNKYLTPSLTLRGGSQYISFDNNEIYVGFLHSHYKTDVSPHKAIYRGHLSVINVTSFKVLYISEPLIWNVNNTGKQYEIMWQESSPTGIIRWAFDNNNNDIMYISWNIGGIQNGGIYKEIITKQTGFYQFIINGLQHGFNEYINHPYWEERVKQNYFDFFNVRIYDKNSTGDKWVV